MLLGALPTWPHSRGWGYYPTGRLGLVLITVLILVLMGQAWETVRQPRAGQAAFGRSGPSPVKALTIRSRPANSSSTP
jgi:hypothetical protein